MCDKSQCGYKSKTSSSEVDSEVMQKLNEAFAKLTKSVSSSLLKKYLTLEVFEKLKGQKTSYGSTLLDVIQSGVENLDSGIGVYAPDPEAYTTFADLFDPIIEEYHGGFGPGDVHPASDWGDSRTLGNLDPTGKYVISTRVRCGRSLKGYRFNPTMTKDHYLEIQQKVSEALKTLEGDLKGTYYPLEGMDKTTQQRLIDEHFLFKEGDRFLQAANACQYWPVGRGIFYNEDKTFLVWVNEEDHLRIISMQKGGDLAAIYDRLVKAVTKIGEKFAFARHQRIGFLTFCPTNLGTTVRASVHIRIPKLSADRKKLDNVADMFNLQVRGTRGEHSETEGGVFDISNKRRMGLTEYEALMEMKNGILQMINLEDEM